MSVKEELHQLIEQLDEFSVEYITLDDLERELGLTKNPRE